jgi:Transcriptional regulatory protein, C terminal
MQPRPWRLGLSTGRPRDCLAQIDCQVVNRAPEGSKVRLTEKESSILRYLYRAGQRPVSRETLLQEVWGYNSGVTTHTLETRSKPSVLHQDRPFQHEKGDRSQWRAGGHPQGRQALQSERRIHWCSFNFGSREQRGAGCPDQALHVGCRFPPPWTVEDLWTWNFLTRIIGVD